AIVIVLAAAGAARFDVLENRAMLALLEGGTGAPRVPSLWKWWLIFVAVLASVPAFFDRTARPFRRIVGYLGAIVGGAAALEGIGGAWIPGDKLSDAAAGRVSALRLREPF